MEILAGVYAGVPMLTSPVGLDQFTSRALIVDCWKIGMNVINEVGAEKIVKREEVALTVKKFMDISGDDEESKLMMGRANELKKSCRNALAKGGSSTVNLDDFIRNILQQVTMESSRMTKRQHVVVLPYPGRGHINPVINFCKLLTTKFLAIDDLRITFVVTEEWLGFIESSASESRLPPQIHLRSIPNVIPSELVRGLDLGGFFVAVQTKMEDPFEELLDQLMKDDDPAMVVTTIIA
ncbi:UDP-glycosyltransferase 87A2-like, partial [Papaver somniferum]|uniref:UDP-glycosyltransferase 87A2-like n=1 Tax=Papaver somniferum TaxID=3469 RepID=UPI000E70146D